MTTDHVEALRETLEELRASEFPDLDAEVVAQIVTIYADQGKDAARKARELQDLLTNAMGEEATDAPS
jgi:hypothetical protein